MSDATFYTFGFQYDLVCDRTVFVSLSSSIYLFGILVGAPISGFLSDGGVPRHNVKS